MITEIISTGAGILISVITIFINWIKSKLNAKLYSAVEKIAVTVEEFYDGYTSSEKLRLFKDICIAEKLNVKKAVKYLEEKIIPVSRKINNYIPQEEEEKEKELID